MPTTEAVTPATTRRYAEDLLDALVDHGPATAEELCTILGWSRGRFGSALRYAREHLTKPLGIAIPSPTPDTGWVYQETTEWGPVAAGASHSLGAVESRLLAVLRDVDIVLPHLTKGSVDWRRAMFLHKHLSHLTSTLKEIK